MRKALLVFFMCICVGYASTPKFLGPLIESHQPVVFNYYDNHEWILGLEDGSFWKVHVLKEKRKQTWYEWWNNITPTEWLLDDPYFMDPANWNGSLALRVYKSETPIFSECTHILEHETTGQKVFAELIPFGGKYIPSLAFADRFFDYPEGDSIDLSCKIENNSDFLKNMIFLNNDSCWRIFPFEKNSRSWAQWLRSVEIDQPDSMFVFQLSDWSINDKIQVYFLKDDLSNNSKYDVNKLESKFKKEGIFLIENLTKKHLVYAEKVALSELACAFEEYTKIQRKKGYDHGYSNGYTTGYNNGTFYERSRIQRDVENSNSGYEKAYRDGYHQAQDDFQNPAYEGQPPPYAPRNNVQPSAPAFQE